MARPPTPFTADLTPMSIVIVCECGWRTVNTDRRDAWADAHRHAMGHQKQRGARQARERLRHAPTALEQQRANAENSRRARDRNRPPSE